MLQRRPSLVTRGRHQPFFSQGYVFADRFPSSSSSKLCYCDHIRGLIHAERSTRNFPRPVVNARCAWSSQDGALCEVQWECSFNSDRCICCLMLGTGSSHSKNAPNKNFPGQKLNDNCNRLDEKSIKNCFNSGAGEHDFAPGLVIHKCDEF